MLTTTDPGMRKKRESGKHATDESRRTFDLDQIEANDSLCILTRRPLRRCGATKAQFTATRILQAPGMKQRSCTRRVRPDNGGGGGGGGGGDSSSPPPAPAPPPPPPT